MNDYDTPEIRCSLRNLSRVTECYFLHTKECLEVWLTKGWPQLTFYSLHTRECQKVIFNFVHTTGWPEGTYFLKEDEFVISTSLSPVTYCR